MPLISLPPEPLPLKHMAQVAPTIRTYNLRPQHPQGAVLETLHGAGDGLEIGGPPAARVELLVRRVQRRGAAGAGVDALGRVVLIVLASAGTLRVALAEDAELF